MNALRNSEVRSCNHRYSGQAIRITRSECVFVALVFQCTLLMHCTILSVASPTLQYFFTLSYKQHDFREKVIGHEYVF